MRAITISGNLGKDPEIRETKNGRQVANFSVAVRKNRPDENGEYGADWFRCAVWGGRVKTVERFFKKGSHVVLSGDFETSEYEGNMQLEINVTAFDLPDSTSNCAGKPSGGQKETKPYHNSVGGIGITDDDLPF